jgi:hypothetical protein
MLMDGLGELIPEVFCWITWLEFISYRQSDGTPRSSSLEGLLRAAGLVFALRNQ